MSMAANALTIKYDPKVDTKEYNTFTEEYFSGSDVTLYLDGEKITNISGLQYTLQEQLKPIYGYASRTFDDMAIGNRIVIGSFKIAVSNPTESYDPANTTITNTNEADTVMLITNNPKPSWAETVIPLGTENTSSNANGTYKSSVIYSDDTMKAQLKLQKLGYIDSTNGMYDSAMKDAVTNFQVEYNLNTTGVLDAETLAELNKDNAHQSTINTDNTKLKAGPGASYKTIQESLPNNTPVTILDTVNDWYYIKLSNSKKGYIAKINITV